MNHSEPLDPTARYTLLPVLNYSETPQAGEKVEAILTTMLRAQGLGQLGVYASDASTVPELDERVRYERALAWAKSQGFKHGVTGSVVEWRYKTGVEGEAAIGVSLRVVDVDTGRVVWSASGANTGWARDTLGSTAQRLLKSLVEQINFAH